MRLGNSRYLFFLIVILMTQSAVASGPHPILAFDSTNKFYFEDGSSTTTSSIHYSKGEMRDIDQDGLLELPYLDSSGNLKIIDKNGNTEELASNGRSSKATVATGDLDNDGKISVFYPGGNNGYIHKYEYGGEGVVELTTSASAKAVFGLSDFDQDSNTEVVYAGTSSTIKWMKKDGSKDGSTGYSSIGSNNGYGAGPVGDFDKDGEPRAMVVDGSNQIAMIDSDGNKEAISETSVNKAPVAAYDMGGDDRLEAVYSDKSGNIEWVYLNNGTVKNLKDQNGDSISANKKYGATSRGIGIDLTPPKYSQGYPFVASKNETGFNITVKSNEAGKAYFVTVSNNSGQPSANEIKNGKNSSGGTARDSGSKTITASSAANLTASKLSQDTSYDVYLLIEDGSGNQNISSKLDNTTEKALVEKNVSQGISMGRKDTSRRTSLGKSQVTGLSFASSGLTKSFTNRLLTESLGFSSGKDRKQSLDKNMVTGMAFSRSGSNFKSTFPILSSSIVTGSTVSDIYSTALKLNSVFELSDSSSGTAIFDGSVTETFGLDISQGKGIVQRTLELILGFSPSEERSTDVDRLSQTGLDVDSSTSTGLAVVRSFNSGLTLAPQIQIQQNILRLFGIDLGLESGQFRDQSLQRSENDTITGSFSTSQSLTMGRLILDTFSQSLDASRSEGFLFRSFNQGVSASGSFEGLTGRTLRYSFGVTSNPIRSGAELTRILLSDLIAGNSPSTGSSFSRGSNQSLIAQNSFSSTGMFFGSATQPLSVGQSFVGSPSIFRSLAESLLVGEGQNSETFFGRSEYQGIDSSVLVSRSNSVSRILGTGISTTQTFQVFDGVIALIDQLIGVEGRQNEVMEASRGQDTSLEASSDYSSSISFFRTFTQSVGFDLELADLIDFVLEFFREDSDDVNDGDGNSNDGNEEVSDDDLGGGGGGGIGNIGGQNQTQALDNGTESPNNMTQDKDAANGENVSLSDTNRSSSISVNVSLESENESKATVELENVSSGKTVSLNLQEKPRDDSQTSKSSQDSETTEDHSIELESISFEVEKKSEDSAINVTTVENPSKLNITLENKIYKATEVSTDVEADNAELIYNVQKSFLSQNNATKNDLVVNRWKNSSRIQTLPTELLNESASNLTVKAASPNGFSIFTVGLKNTTSDASVTSREFNFEYTFPNIQLVKLFKAILILSSLYLIRYPLLKTLFTLDIRLSYIIEEVRVRVLELRRRLRWWLDAEEGREEFGLAGDVNSLRNKKEALQFKKKRLEKEVKRKKELRNRYLMRLELLTNKVEKWREKLDD